jgi:hypothetical protein
VIIVPAGIPDPDNSIPTVIGAAPAVSEATVNVVVDPVATKVQVLAAASVITPVTASTFVVKYTFVFLLRLIVLGIDFS